MEEQSSGAVEGLSEKWFVPLLAGAVLFAVAVLVLAKAFNPPHLWGMLAASAAGTWTAWHAWRVARRSGRRSWIVASGLLFGFLVPVAALTAIIAVLALLRPGGI